MCNSNQQNKALRRLSAEGLRLTQVKRVAVRLQTENAEAKLAEAQEEAEQIRRRRPYGDDRDELVPDEIIERYQAQVEQAREGRGHYPGVRRETAEALGLRVGEWWDEVYNLATT